MTIKIEINPSVTDILSLVITNAKEDWIRIVKSNTSFDDFNNQSFPTTDTMVGEWINDSARSTIPGGEIKYDAIQAAQDIIGADNCSNCIIYQANSAMGWHTNSDNPGTRIYYTYTLGNAIFRFKDHSDNIVDDYDNYGWTARSFHIDSTKPLWHTIWTDQIRFSFGFNIYD